jgi:hypothetical protein
MWFNGAVAVGSRTPLSWTMLNCGVEGDGVGWRVCVVDSAGPAPDEQLMGLGPVVAASRAGK